jgi:hypothetical protein
MAEIISKEHAAASSHWYTQDGREAHTYINKKGGVSNTTLRQARTENLVPSVTSVIRLAAAPGLQNWKDDQLILAALSLPRVPDETDDEFVARVKLDAKEQARKAAEFGTLVHSYVQEGFNPIDMSGLCQEGVRYYASAEKCLSDALGAIKWVSEKSFAVDGYGGKCDLHAPGYVVDLKTTSKPLEGLKTWPEHSYQLSSYRHGLGMDDARCFILYIHTETAESKLIELDAKELETGWKCFSALLQFFYAKTGLGGQPCIK